MLFMEKATPVEYEAGLDRAIENGWVVLHESGTFVKFTQRARSCSRDLLLQRQTPLHCWCADAEQRTRRERRGLCRCL